MDFGGDLQAVTHRRPSIVAVTLLSNWLLSRGGKDAEIRKGRGKISQEGDATEEARNVALGKGGQRRAGEKPEASDRYWAL
jgi:hypothetical protein